VEERPLAKENTEQSNPCRTQSRESGSNGLERVREVAKKDKEVRFTALLHHGTVDLLRDSYSRLKKKAAPGVDGVTWREYGEGLEGRISDLHGRIHRGAYQAQPSRRVWIPKTDGRQRPLGIAALEDKIVQHAVGRVLNQIWEEDFLGFSYWPNRAPSSPSCALRLRFPALVRLLRRYFAAVRLPRAEAKSRRACWTYRSSLSPPDPPPCDRG